MGGFYAAYAYAGLCDDMDPLRSHGAVKGMLLRHLRWWAANSQDSFNTDGTLSIGYLYPNMFMCENYNSPQSPYWALKSLLVVALSKDDAFWTAKELPHPLEQSTDSQSLENSGIQVVKPARQIVCNLAQGKHHFLLSSGQFCVWPMKATQAKYGKFAYSSAFGFSVPTGPLLAQMAPDSTLALSRDGGETWAVRWTSIGETRFQLLAVAGLQGPVTATTSRWKPWADAGVEVESTLIPPCAKWPDWHVRIHRIRLRDAVTSMNFGVVDSGFAIYGQRHMDGRVIQTVKKESSTIMPLESMQDSELAVEAPTSALVVSGAGASGVVDYSPREHYLTTRGDVLRPDPNTNLTKTKTMIPNIRHSMKGSAWHECIVASGIFAIATKPGEGQIQEQELDIRWQRRPSVGFTADGELLIE